MSQLSNTQKFKTVTTNLGRNAVAMAHATGSSIKLTHMAVGDGSGQNIEPTSAMTKLVHEVYRGQINDIVISSDVEGEFTAELLIPQSAGGFFIREVGLFFEDGTMFAIGNTPLTEKTELASGAATDLLVRMIIRVLDAGTIEIFIDPAQVLATRSYVDRSLSDHDHDKDAHKERLNAIENDFQAALDTKLDKSALSDDIDSTSTTTAASSKAVNDLRLAVPGLAMPSYNFIDIPLSETVPRPNNPTYHTYKGKAVADGYIYVCLFYSNNGKYYDANITVIDDNKEILYRVSVGHVFQYYSAIMPIKKGMDFNVIFPAEGLSTFTLRFIYAQGGLPE